MLIGLEAQAAAVVKLVTESHGVDVPVRLVLLVPLHKLVRGKNLDMSFRAV